MRRRDQDRKAGRKEGREREGKGEKESERGEAKKCMVFFGLSCFVLSL